MLHYQHFSKFKKIKLGRWKILSIMWECGSGRRRQWSSDVKVKPSYKWREKQIISGYLEFLLQGWFYTESHQQPDYHRKSPWCGSRCGFLFSPEKQLYLLIFDKCLWSVLKEKGSENSVMSERHHVGWKTCLPSQLVATDLETVHNGTVLKTFWRKVLKLFLCIDEGKE